MNSPDTLVERKGAVDEKPPGGLLHAWLLIAIFFEYVRPASFIPGLGAVPLNSIIPLGLLMFTLISRSARPFAVIARDTTSRWITVFLLLIAFSILQSSVTLYAYRVFAATAGYFFLFFMITRIVTTQRRVRGVLGALLVSHIVLIAMNPNAILDPSNRNYIIGGPFLGDGNDFALSLCILLPLTVALILTSRSYMTRTVLAIFAAVTLLAIIASQSRGGTIAIAIVAGYLFLRSGKKLYSAMALVMCVLILLAYAPAQYFDRMRTISAYQADTSATARIEAWKAGARMAIDNPVFGVGSGNFPNNFPKYRGAGAPVRWMNAHSMYFQVLGELGVTGLIAFIAILGSSFAANRRLERSWAGKPPGPPQVKDGVDMLRFLNAAILGLAVAGAFLSAAYYPHIFILSAVCIAQRAILAQVRPPLP